MPKINREEYEVLKELDDRWKWIARGKYTELHYFQNKPRKIGNKWASEFDNAIDWKESWVSLSFIAWEDEEPYNIAELIEEYEDSKEYKDSLVIEYFMDKAKEGEETEVKKDKEWAFIELGKIFPSHAEMNDYSDNITDTKCELLNKVYDILSQLDEPEPKNITLQDITLRLWELPLNNRKLWLARLNDEFQEGYVVPLGLKTTDGEEQYLTYNGSYFASRRNKYLQQTFATLEEIPEFYRGLAERVL